MNGLAGLADRQAAHSPRVRQERRGNTEAHHVRQRIEFPPEIAVCAEKPRDSAVHRVKEDCEANRLRGVIHIGDAAL
jgi:hypothetical protein